MMNTKPRGTLSNGCRLVVKMVDAGPARSNHHDANERNQNEEKIPRQSPQQKRAASPFALADEIVHKKVKLDPTVKKKQVPPTVVKTDNTIKTIVNKKKPKLVPCKSSSVLDEKIVKPSSTNNNNNSTIENSSLTKARPTIKLSKSQSTNDIRSVTTTMATKKKEPIPSPLKTKINLNPQVVIKKTITKIPGKTSIKPESTSTSTVKSPPIISIKQEPSPPPTNTSSNNIPTSTSINSLKKIPKKPVTVKGEEKRSQSLKPPSTADRKSTVVKSSQKEPSASSISKPKVKRDSSVASMKAPSKNNERLSKIKTVKDQSNAIRTDQSKAQKSSRSPSQSHIDLPSLPSTDILRPLIPTPPASQFSVNEDSHIQTPMDVDRHTHDDQLQLSDDSNSPDEQVLVQRTEIPITRISYSDQSDTHESDRSIGTGYDDDDDDDDDDEDLPASLTNDDLRYKLIYIYQRFQLNSTKDLIIFVRFFKRHHLIDISTLSMTKSTNEMFTYDLFTLSPSHIGELAADLGYSTVKTKNSND